MLKRFLILAAIAWSPAASAQNPAEAEQLFQEGRRLLDAGRVAEACNVFDASYRLDPNVSTLVNLATCRERNGQLATAWAHFVAVANQTASRRDRAAVHARSTAQATAIEPRLSYLIVNVPDTSRVDGLVVTRDGVVLEPGAWNRSLPVDGGTYVIAGKAPGHEAWSTKVVVGRESDRKSVDVPRFHELAVTVEANAVKLDEERDDDELPPPLETGGPGGKRRAAIGVAAAGGLALVGAVLLDGSARSRYEDATREPDPVHQQSLYDSAVTRRHGAQVVAGVGIGCVATGVVLWMLDRRRAPSVVASIGADGAVVSWSGGF